MEAIQSELGEHADVRVWSQSESPEWVSLNRQLPVLKENELTQLGSGSARLSVHLAATDKIYLQRLHVTTRTLAVSLPRPDFVVFMFPLGASGAYRINGRTAEIGTIHRLDARDGFHLYGDDRDEMGLAVHRQTLTEALAALRGVGPEDVKLPEAAMPLPRPRAAEVIARLDAILRAHTSMTAPDRTRASASSLSEAVLETLLDVHLRTADGEPHRGTRRSPSRLVRLAEERFEFSQGAASLADLCRATSVSARTLYRAFHAVCDTPPLDYFQKRQLTQARSALLHRAPARGAVKSAALDAGFTELGRFSVRYRELFGECPSATLSGAADCGKGRAL